MDAHFTAPFCFLHILHVPQIFSLLFFSNESNSKGFHSFSIQKSKNSLLLYSGLYVFAISDEFCGCLVTVFIGNKAQTLENVDIITKIYIFFLSLKVLWVPGLIVEHFPTQEQNALCPVFFPGVYFCCKEYMFGTKHLRRALEMSFYILSIIWKINLEEGTGFKNHFLICCLCSAVWVLKCLDEWKSEI